VTQKVPLVSLALKDLDKLIDRIATRSSTRDPRPTRSHGGKGDKAFPPITLHKPDRDGNPTGPVVRTVTMVIDKLSGIPVRGGIAKNDTMLRVDVFRHKKDGKFHLVPVYVHHAVAKELPNRAIVAFKDEDEWTLIDDGYSTSAFPCIPTI
jgi:CRISPR-associated endonuclease Csn1